MRASEREMACLQTYVAHEQVIVIAVAIAIVIL